jgi:hypothetical protein
MPRRKFFSIGIPKGEIIDSARLNQSRAVAIINFEVNSPTY